MELTISVFFKDKSFSYKSFICPVVGDILPSNIEYGFGEGDFVVVQRLIHIENRRLLTIVVQ